MDYGLPDSSVHGILQARILECVVIPFSRGSSQPKDLMYVSCIAGGFFTIQATREAQERQSISNKWPMKIESFLFTTTILSKSLVSQVNGVKMKENSTQILTEKIFYIQALYDIKMHFMPETSFI